MRAVRGPRVVLTAVAGLTALSGLVGCGGQAAAPSASAASTVASAAYSCTRPGLALLPAVRRAVTEAFPRAATRPRVRNYCGGGLQAEVELTLAGTVATATPAVRRALRCGPTTSRPGATGRTSVMVCHGPGRAPDTRATLAPYLPSDDPHGPTVLVEVVPLGPGRR